MIQFLQDCWERWFAVAGYGAGQPRSSGWAGVRAKHLKIQKACQACGATGQLEVHHVVPFHIQPELELEPGNLLTLCNDCHLTWGHLRNWQSWNDHVRQDVSWYYLRVQNRPRV